MVSIGGRVGYRCVAGRGWNRWEEAVGAVIGRLRVTLGGAEGATLGGDGVVSPGEGSGVTASLKMAANWRRAVRWRGAGCGKGELGSGFCRACSKAWAACVAASADEVAGSVQW
jgi:hypothetical protein